MRVLRNKLYYLLKPSIPPGLRLVLRRWYSRRLRPQVGNTWPILPGSEKPPPGWVGWPGNKQFSVVLTHDVEDRVGAKRCLELMRMEAELGFRSSFNLIPEGSYNVSFELRAELARNGFEVGVHDLYHDGKLYSSFSHFCRCAEKVNGYLKEWGATGFRSGFMLHNLEWAHKLNIRYDASTFDTDPFEPQPDGVGTIFPFWVPNPNRGERAGYVELPYTLVQDSTLFLLLGDRTPQIWFQKVDWVAKNGGMVLINMHPDYACFGSNGAGSSQYPAAWYRQLLEYIRAKYAGAYWHVTAGEVADWYRDSLSGEQSLLEPGSESYDTKRIDPVSARP